MANIQQLEQDLADLKAKFAEFVHGDEFTSVQNNAGTYPSFAKAIKDHIVTPNSTASQSAAAAQTKASEANAAATAAQLKAGEASTAATVAEAAKAVAVAAFQAYGEPVAWAAGVEYLKDAVMIKEGALFYVPNQTHTSGASFAADLAAGKWRLHQGLDSRTGVGRVETFADLRTLQPNYAGQTVDLVGHTIAGLGGGVFVAKKKPGAVDDNGATAVYVGGDDWVWERRLDGFVSPEMFGAGAGLGDDSPRIRACYDFAKRGATLDSAFEIINIRGYSENWVLQTPLVLGDTSKAAIVDIELCGVFKCAPEMPYAIKLRGLKSPRVKLGRIYPNGLEGQNVGLVIENVFYGDIECSGVGNYRVPINYRGDGSYGTMGCAYYRFVCNKAGGSVTDSTIELTTVNGAGYVNSTCTTINGARGVVFSKHTKGAGQIDPYNQNVYELGGLEAITGSGYDWQFSQFNTVLYPRLEKGATLSNLIIESDDCFANQFNFFVCGLENLGVISKSSVVNSRILDKNGAHRYEKVSGTSDGNITHADRVDSVLAPNLTVFTNGTRGAEDQGKPLSRYRGFFKDANGVVHPYGLGTPFSTKRITSYVSGDVVSVGYATTIDIAVDNGFLDLRSHPDREFEGFEIILNVWQAMTNMTFSSSNGGLPISSAAFSAGAGAYMLKRIDYRWRVSKIGDAFRV